MKHMINRRESLNKKLLSNARAIVTNQVSVPFGVVRMTMIMNWMQYYKVRIDIDLNIFKTYYSAIQSLSIGSERLKYNREFLRKQDILLDKVYLELKEKIIDKCFEIIEKYE